MNKNKLKTYAPQARRDFIAAVTQRAHLLGITATEALQNRRQGDVVIIDGREWPAKIGEQRKRLIKRIERDGFEPTMEAAAYTWFNRFAALRYMELHDYLGHGHRVLSNRDGGQPEILGHALDVDLPGLNRETLIELKLAGNRDGELYRLLLVAQCNALSAAMPFLFERIDDETELLLPDNLLRTDSVIAKLVNAIPEEDWQEVEIIGWLYQFYISEKKDQVIGKVVKSEDIPAATQLFTPNWIVKYLVQNSVGRLWLMANLASTLKSWMDYYIEPAEQTPEVQAQLDALIQARMNEDGGSLNPESITVLDPACGSGHILVEAYDLLKQIYLERGYQPRSIPRLILEKNLYGLDIDDRAAQLAGFALLMKARADDRRLLNVPPRLNVLAIQESGGMDREHIIKALVGDDVSPKWTDSNPFAEADLFPETRKQRVLGEETYEEQPAGEHRPPFGITRAPLVALLETFAQAKTFGSLIQIPEALDSALPGLVEGLQRASESGDVFARSAAAELVPLVWQTSILAMKFDAVVANPPYMGNGYFNEYLAEFAEAAYDDWAGDLFTCFIKSSFSRLKPSGAVSLITIATWSFLPTYKKMRHQVLSNHTVLSIIDNGRGVWGSDHGTLMFSAQNKYFEGYVLACKGLSPGKGKVQHVEEIRTKFLETAAAHGKQTLFLDTPSAIISAKISENFLVLLLDGQKLKDIGSVRQGIKTGDMPRFMRLWHEVSSANIFLDCDSQESSRSSNARWYPCNKGGDYRKWYGNIYHVLNWKNDGEDIKNFKNDEGKLKSRPQNIQYFFREGITWSTVTMGRPSFRYSSKGRAFESGGSTIFFSDQSVLYFALGTINSYLGEVAASILSPKVSLGEGAVSSFPIPALPEAAINEVIKNAGGLVNIFKQIEQETEESLDFRSPMLWLDRKTSVFKYYLNCEALYASRLNSVVALENRVDEIIANTLADRFEPQITNAWSDYGVDLLSESNFSRRLISFSIGCIMGRYSLDESGLIYAHGGNVGFDPTRYRTFPADADGIVPVTDEAWFEDDAANRIREFLLAVWGRETLDENMAWLAESVGRKGSETPEETVRRYLSAGFFKDHLQTYKKRPIYWLFSSGKQKAFEALVYLHRYHEGTLARMRSEYVVPLTAKLLTRIDMLQKDADAASSASSRNKINKQIESLKKKHLELLAFDEKLRHYADMRITLDLDDGVKVNYGKFGDLLAEVKAVTGGGGED